MFFRSRWIRFDWKDGRQHGGWRANGRASGLFVGLWTVPFRLDLSEDNENQRQYSRINGEASVIGNIAEQTNMLALNAAIEAAHAGCDQYGYPRFRSHVRGALAVAKSISALDIMSSRVFDGVSAMSEMRGLAESVENPGQEWKMKWRS